MALSRRWRHGSVERLSLLVVRDRRNVVGDVVEGVDAGWGYGEPGDGIKWIYGSESHVRGWRGGGRIENRKEVPCENVVQHAVRQLVEIRKLKEGADAIERFMMRSLSFWKP